MNDSSSRGNMEKNSTHLTPVGGPPPSSDKYRFTSPEERARRLAALRSAMAEAGMDVLVVTGRDDIRYRGRAFYVSDVWQLVADVHVVILPEGSPVFIGGQVFGVEQAELSDWVPDHRSNNNSGQEIAAVLAENDLSDGTVGVVGMSDASFAFWHYTELKNYAPEATIVDATRIFEDVRQISSEADLAAFADTSSVMNQIYAELEPLIRPGMTEIELASQSHRVARAHGLRDPMVLMQTTPFGAISFGTTKEITRDDIVCLWIESAGPSGHWVEYRRCYSFGAPSQSYKDYWDLHVEATIAGLQALRPGAMASEFAIAAEQVLKRGGFELGYSDMSDDHFMYSLHGIGTDAIQGVWVPGNDRVVKENEVVNIHPTLSFSHADLAKFGWLGVTDNAKVTSAGAQVMTHAAGFPDGFKEL